MPPRQIVYALIVFLHDLFTVVWIGGLVSLSLFVLPSAIHLWGRGPEARGLMDGIQRRLRVAVYVSIVGLLLTGILMSRRNPAFTGLFSVGNTYSAILAAKHIAVLSMVVVALVRSVLLGRRQGPRIERLKVAMLMLNTALGVLVLLLSAFNAALSAGAPPA